MASAIAGLIVGVVMVAVVSVTFHRRTWHDSAENHGWTESTPGTATVAESPVETDSQH